MYICPTCDSEIEKPSYQNNRPFCPGGHRVFNESASKALLNGLAWGILLLVAASLGQAWILAIPVAVVGITLYKAWRLSRHKGLTRRLSKSFLCFGVGFLLPVMLLIYPGSKQLSIDRGLLQHLFSH